MPKAHGQAGHDEGRALLLAVERVVEAPERIRERVDRELEEVRQSLPEDAAEQRIRAVVDRRLIAFYSNRTALAGGAAALPALVPGVGTLAASVVGGLADMTLCLKYEVELVLALAAVRGYDITDPRERHLAYLLAAAHTYEASGGRNALWDLLKVEFDAVWGYSARQLGKLVATLFVRLALHFAGKGLLRAVPFVGLVVASAANKALTRRVGVAAMRSLDERASAGRAKPKPAGSAKAPKGKSRKVAR